MIFGQSFTYTLETFDDDKVLTGVPAQTITAFIFDSLPDRASALSGAGAIQSQSFSHVGVDSISIEFDAVNDPDPSGMTHHRPYWVAVNFKIEALEQTQTVIKPITITRPIAKDRQIGVTREKIAEAYPNIFSFLSETQVDAMISLAKTDLLSDLKQKGIRWAEIHRPDELFNALLFKSFTYIHASQIQRQGDRFAVLAEAAKLSYNSIIRNLAVLIEADGTVTHKQKTGGIIYGIR